MPIGSLGVICLKYYKEIDGVRFWAIICVVIIHVTAPFTQSTTYNIVYDTALSFNLYTHMAVPLFIFISGYVLSIKYMGQFDLMLFYDKRLRSVIPQYIFFTIIYLAYYYFENNWNPSFSVVLKSLIRFDTSYHFWFFPLILELYLIYPFLSVLYCKFESIKAEWLFLIICLTIQIVHNFYHIADVLDYLVYAVVGMGIQRNYQKAYRFFIKNKIAILVANILLFVFEYVLYRQLSIKSNGYNNISHHYFSVTNIYNIFFYISSILVLILVTTWIMKSSRSVFLLMEELGKHSFGIYLVHVIWLMYFTTEFPNLTYESWYYYPLCFIFVTTFSYTTVKIISFMPYSVDIVGSRSKLRLTKREI